MQGVVAAARVSQQRSEQLAAELAGRQAELRAALEALQHSQASELDQARSAVAQAPGAAQASGAQLEQLAASLEGQAVLLRGQLDQLEAQQAGAKVATETWSLPTQEGDPIPALLPRGLRTDRRAAG
ncbi:hypothetical protein [Vulcanococcus limneticus]|uniref:hypothetical protein n=1 Tax=Vulcanococcus limneticus TaxID=2170428 RepID=UPI00398BCD05